MFPRLAAGARCTPATVSLPGRRALPEAPRCLPLGCALRASCWVRGRSWGPRTGSLGWATTSGLLDSGLRCTPAPCPSVSRHPHPTPTFPVSALPAAAKSPRQKHSSAPPPTSQQDARLPRRTQSGRPPPRCSPWGQRSPGSPGLRVLGRALSARALGPSQTPACRARVRVLWLEGLFSVAASPSSSVPSLFSREEVSTRRAVNRHLLGTRCLSESGGGGENANCACVAVFLSKL